MAFDTDDKTRASAAVKRASGSPPSAAGAVGRSWLLPLGVGLVLGIGATALVLWQRDAAGGEVTPSAAEDAAPSNGADTVRPSGDVVSGTQPSGAADGTSASAVANRATPSGAADGTSASAVAKGAPPSGAADGTSASAVAKGTQPSGAADGTAARVNDGRANSTIGAPGAVASAEARGAQPGAAKAPPPSAAAAVHAQPPPPSAASASAPAPAPAPASAAAPVAKPPPPSAAPTKPPVTEEEKLAAAAVVTTPAENVMDEMIDDALAHPKGKGERPAAPAPTAVPLAPSRDDVVKAMGTLVPAIRGCAQGQSGLAPMTIVVKNDGHVESAALSGGPFQGTASGGCMEGVVRRAKFPRFQQASFRVQFPFAVQ